MNLDNHINAAMIAEYKLGTHDCATFAFAGDPEVLKPYEGKYESKTGIGRLVKAAGCSDAIEMVIKRCVELGYEKVTAAQPGDIAVVRMSDGEGAFGIHLNGDSIAALHHAGGVEFIHPMNVASSWRRKCQS